jgi:myo-inositol-1(or 4)-monophosphatase
VDARPLLELAIDAARRTGELLLERFHAPAHGVSSKSSPTDLVSDADRDAERLLIDIIRSRRAGDGILGEESGASEQGGDVRWVIDPLDGTVNFLFGIPVWAVSVAAEGSSGTLAGVVYDPNRDEMFSAIAGDGARLNDAIVGVSNKTDLAEALVGTGFSYEPAARAVQAEMLQGVLPVVRDVRRAGSAALDLASVACGRLDGVYEAPMEPWDKAAGTLLVREAGGVVSELPPPLEHLSPGVIAGGRAVHDRLRTLVLGAIPPATATQARH